MEIVVFLRNRRLAAPLPDRRQGGQGQERRSPRANASSAASTASTRRSGRSGSAPAARTRSRIPTSSTTTASTSTAPAWSPSPRATARTPSAIRPTASTSSTRYSRVDMAAGPRTAPRRRTASWSCKLEEADISELKSTGWQPPGGLRRQGPRRQDRHLGHHLPAAELRPEQEVSGHRVHLRRAAGLVRAQDVQPVQPLLRRSDRSGLHRRADRRHGDGATAPRRSTTSAGRTSRTPASPTASSGIKALAKKYPYVRHHRASASTARRPAGRTRRGRCCSIREFYKVAVSRPAAATTTAWTRSSWNEQWMGYPVGPHYDEPVQHRQRPQAARASCC